MVAVLMRTYSFGCGAVVQNVVASLFCFYLFIFFFQRLTGRSVEVKKQFWALSRGVVRKEVEANAVPKNLRSVIWPVGTATNSCDKAKNDEGCKISGRPFGPLPPASTICELNAMLTVERVSRAAFFANHQVTFRGSI